MPKSKRDLDKFMQEARERFQMSADAEAEDRKQAEIDLQMYLGEQWDERLKREREMSGKPAFVFNKLTGPVQQVSNDSRKNKPSIKIIPKGSGATKDKAKIREGMVRHIQYSSDASIAYDTAVLYASVSGRGMVKLTRDWVEDDVVQELKIEEVSDPWGTIYLDPRAKKATKSDMRFAFEIQNVSKEEYLSRFGKETAAGKTNFWEGGDNPAPDWFGEDIRIASYWCVEETPDTRIQFSDGSKVWKSELPADVELPPEAVVTERKGTRKTICNYLIDGAEILEETEWKGKRIPLFPVYGQQLSVKGKSHCVSVIRHARDAQKLHNFYRSSEAETISLGSKAPWVGYRGQFKDARWATANTKNWAYLEVEPVLTDTGQVAPLPMRNTFEPPIQALSLGAAQVADDIKASTNIFDASLGARSNETSGVAIRQREAQGDIANYHILDNLSRVHKDLGREILAQLPITYDTQREVQLIGEDETPSTITVNAPYQDPETGEVQHHQMDDGEYDVVVTTGPEYSTVRQEAFDMLIQLSQGNPMVMQLGGDIIWKNSDIPGADQLAERWKKTLPPNLLEDEQKKQGQQQIPPQLQAQMQQMAQALEATTQQLHQLSGVIETKQVELDAQMRLKQMELDSRERIAEMQTRAGLTETAAKLEGSHAVELLRQEIAVLHKQMEHERAERDAQRQQAQFETQQAAQQQAAQQNQQNESPEAAQ